MVTETDIPSLASLDAVSYVDDRGQLPDAFAAKVGVYAIFDQTQTLQYIGYSRDVGLSLKQHLVRQPQRCYWVKAQTIERPNRTILETIREAWIAENGAQPPGNASDEAGWSQAIDVRQQMTPEEQAQYDQAIDELAQSKVLKQVARRVEGEILETLKTRGVQADLRFNPKLKESGLLDLK